MPIVRIAFIAAPLLTIAACAPAASLGGFDSPNPSARLYAVEDAARANDDRPETLRRIVEQLDSDDAAVRLIAIDTLKKLTGETLGYRHFDNKPARQAAIREWVRYLESDSAPRAPDAATETGARVRSESHG